MMDWMLYILAGLGVGFTVGLTGVGGGSLMTPLLLLFGFTPSVAIGTDLLYAGLTKSSGVWFHQRRRNVNWKVVLLLSAGSIPVSMGLSFLVMDAEFRAGENFETLLTSVLGVMLIVTALVIAFQGRIQQRLTGNGNDNGNGNGEEEFGFQSLYSGFAQRHAGVLTLLMGMLLGLCVTLSSVGAGAFGAAVLFMLYPHLKAVQIIGTDIAHAVPLTLVAGVGYLYNGLVDFLLLGALLCGSLPGIWLGTHMGSRLPEKVMRAVLAFLLFSLGLNFSLGAGH